MPWYFFSGLSLPRNLYNVSNEEPMEGYDYMKEEKPSLELMGSYNS